MRRTLQVAAALLLIPACAPAAPARKKRSRPKPQATAPAYAPLIEQAQKALFAGSDSDRARPAAQRALDELAKSSPAAGAQETQAEALFLLMESAALQADEEATLDAAVRLLETIQGGHDDRATVAASRVLDLAGNTRAFRALAGRVRELARRDGAQRAHLQAALLAAAADGLPGDSVEELARSAGCVIEWRIAGGFGRYPNLDFDRAWPPERDGLGSEQYGSAAVERFRFDDGFVDPREALARSGVFYAAAEVAVAAAGEWRLRVESGGTLAVSIDGATVLVRDDRAEDQPQIVARGLRLGAGSHRVLVKFLKGAAPFRVALLPGATRPPAGARTSADKSEAERRYLAGALRFWAGNFAAVIGQYSRADRSRPAIETWLLAQAWERSFPGASEQAELLRAVLAADRNALAAEFALARRAWQDDRAEEALSRTRAVAARRPGFAAAQELLARMAARLNWQAEAAAAYRAAIDLHPSCAVLQSAARWFAGVARFHDAGEAVQRLDGCAPGSLAYPQALADAGQHRQAAAALAKLVARHPLDHDARRLLATELWLAGDPVAGRAAADELRRLTPNSPQALALWQRSGSETAALVQQSGNPEFLESAEFYVPYRRDGARLVRRSARRAFSGGPAVLLLHDRVVQWRPDAALAVYTHRITRVLNRDGIEQYGEVALPVGARLLELRTIKSDGSIAEPELTHAKPTITMPALAPGDAIEEEYVVEYREGAAAHPEPLRFAFGSFDAPTLLSRFVVLSPQQARIAAESVHGAPEPQVRQVAGTTVHLWERDDIAQSIAEPAMPPRWEVLPVVRVTAGIDGWPDVRNYYRNLLAEATHAGPRVRELAAAVRGATEEERGRELYRLVGARVRASQWSGDEVTSAEQTLEQGEGSRTAALLAAARVAGLKAELVLARGESAGKPVSPARTAYSQPLVRMALGDPRGAASYVYLDAESDGLAFGEFPPALARSDALLVAAAGPEFVALPPRTAAEQSVAQAEVTIDAAGNLQARLHVVLGSWRGGQLRAMFRAMAAGQRQQFFDQFAARIFPAAIDARGEVRNQGDPGKPLELEVTCRAPRFLALAAGPVDLEQLVPTLGLRKMFAVSAERRFPLWIDAPLFESATFRVRLPAGVRVAQKPADVELRSPFGSYQARFRVAAGGEWTIRRSFHIPQQRIEPGQYRQFRGFAEAIDDVERQRFVLEPAADAVALVRR